MYLILEPSGDCYRTYYPNEFETLEEAMEWFKSSTSDYPSEFLFYKAVKQRLTLESEEW